MVRIGNWVEERALMSILGQSRGSTTDKSNDTATRITGPQRQPLDYGTTTNLAHQDTLKATCGPNYIEATAPPRRTNLREQERMREAQRIMDERRAAEEYQKELELQQASFGGREPQNRKRAIGSTKTVEESKQNNPLTGQAISFHTHHLGSIHGVTPGDRGVHTFSKNTHFSKPISELLESGER